MAIRVLQLENLRQWLQLHLLAVRLLRQSPLLGMAFSVGRRLVFPIAVGTGPILVVQIVHSADHIGVALVEQFFEEGEVILQVAVGEKAETDNFRGRLMNSFQHVTLPVLLFGAAH